MTAQLPPNLLKLFAPRPALPYARPVGKSPNTIRSKKIDGIAGLLAQIRDDAAFDIAEAGQGPSKKAKTEASSDAPNGDATVNGNGEAKEEGEEDDEKPSMPVTALESPTKDPNFTYAEETRRQIAREEKAKRRKEMFEKAKTSYAPNDNKKARGDPYKTLFIARLSKKATEADVRKEFDMYGNIEYLAIVRDDKGRSRGYCFIVYEREKDMKAAYKDADGLVILGKKILVDVERGRTVRGWKPRRLGGGLGGRPKPVAPSEAPPAFSGGFGGGRGGGGFRGGGRGGFSDRGGGGFRGRGGGFGDRGGFRGGFNDRGPPGGGFGGGGGGAGDRGWGDRSNDRGGFRGGPPGGGFGGGGGGYGGDRGGFGAPDSGYGRGRGIGFQGGFNSGGPPGGGGGFGGGMKRDYDGGDDRDQKRMRY